MYFLKLPFNNPQKKLKNVVPMKKYIPLFVILVLSISACINSDNFNTLKSGTLTVGVFKHAPPAVYEENGELKGYEVELIEEIAKKMNLNVEYKEYLFSDLLNAVNNNEVDCAISDIAITPEREKIVSFTRAYSKTDIVIVVPKNSEIEHITDINGKVIGVTRGTIQDDKAVELSKSVNINILRYDTHDESYNALISGNVDALINEENNFDSVQNSNLNVLDEHLGTIYCGIAVNKNNKVLLSKMDEIILELETEGYFNN